MEDKEWVLKNVEEICANTRDVDEVCMALEHSTIFATAMIKNLTKTILDLQQELSIANKKLDKLDNEIKSVIKIVRQQPSESVEDDAWILGRLDGFLSIIGE